MRHTENRTTENMTEEEFLKQYRPERYEKPSVTVDILVFTVNREQQLQLLLIQRGKHPYLGKWAIPGGFVCRKAGCADEGNLCCLSGVSTRKQACDPVGG